MGSEVIRFYVGLDIGKQQDYTAIAIAEKMLARSHDLNWRGDNFIVQNLYQLRHLQRFPLKTPYPVIVEKIARMMDEPRLARDGKLIMDATGVGEPIADMLKDRGLRPVTVKITGSMEVVQRGAWAYHVPKRDLVSALHALVQSGKLKVSKTLKYADVLYSELENYNYKINKNTGRDTYEAMVESIHDDLVTAVALAAWYGTVAQRHSRYIPENAAAQDAKNSAWNPLGR